MLRSALPLGPSMTISFNGETLGSTKLEVPVDREWQIGPALIETVEVSDDLVAKVVASNDPFPHVTIDGVPGRVTGTVRLYQGSHNRR